MKLEKVLFFFGALTLLYGIGLPILFLFALSPDRDSVIFAYITAPLAITFSILSFALWASKQDGKGRVFVAIRALVSLVSMKLKKALFLLGTLTLVSGIGLPILMIGLSADMGAVLFASVAVPAAVVIACINFALASSLCEGKTNVFARIMVLVSFLFSAYFTYFSIAAVYAIVIGPRAVVIIPNDFVGKFEIQVGKYIEPSWATRNKTFIYEITDTTKPLFVESGWMYCSFENAEYFPKQSIYTMRLFYKNGSALDIRDFKCSYVAKTTIDSNGYQSTSGSSDHIGVEIAPKGTGQTWLNLPPVVSTFKNRASR